MEEEVPLFLYTYDNKPSKQEFGAMKREMSSGCGMYVSGRLISIFNSCLFSNFSEMKVF